MQSLQLQVGQQLIHKFGISGHNLGKKRYYFALGLDLLTDPFWLEKIPTDVDKDD